MKTKAVKIKPEHELINDLYEVGKSKSLGYLPKRTITDEVFCNLTISTVLDYAKENKISYLELKFPEECDIYSGAIFFYHESMLLDILRKNKDCLEKAGVPHDNCLEYIRYISKHTVYHEQYPKAYRVIGLTFNDPRFR
ncbi:hypothetical protein ACFVS2_26585 [Brevibacillus sp. NPDC058079]|uniref:hypothetical protein n=1 Tax=Brevibacillus sp. NPDC058079 TaxID=3346330 RepID=UPI0036E6A35B